MKILNTQDYLKEMASYKKTYKKPFYNFTDEFEEYKNFIICRDDNGDVVILKTNNSYCIIPFNSPNLEECIPLFVWNEDNIGFEEFKHDLEGELKKLSNDTLEEFAKIIGRGYRYDIKMVVENTKFVNTCDFKNFCCELFNRYGLTPSKRDRKTNIRYVKYKQPKNEIPKVYELFSYMNDSETKLTCRYKEFKWVEKEFWLNGIYGNEDRWANHIDDKYELCYLTKKDVNLIQKKTKNKVKYLFNVNDLMDDTEYIFALSLYDSWEYGMVIIDAKSNRCIEYYNDTNYLVFIATEKQLDSCFIDFDLLPETFSKENIEKAEKDWNNMLNELKNK